MEKKITKKDNFNTLLTLAEVKSNARLVAFIEHEIELLDRKASADRKETPRQVQNKELASAVYDFLVDTGKRYTVGELMKNCPALAEVEEMSTSWATSILAILKKDGRADNVMEKRHSYYFAL